VASIREYRAALTESAGCDAILNLSTGSSGNRAHGAARYACLALRPEMGSFDSGSTNFGDWVFENAPGFLRDLARAFRDAGAAPEIECFDASHVTAAIRLRDDGHLSDPLRFQFVLGVRGGAPATVEQLLYMRSLLPADAVWSVCAIGRDQLPMNVLALIAGGHVRTGLEDNLYYARGRLATAHSELVARVVRIASEIGRPVATAAEARTLLRLGAA
jgi:3-keto-5-aminohexanoate cleavage enzyme